MTGPQAAPNTRAPLHLWAIGGIALLWNSMGALDYFMTQTRNAAYMTRFTQEQLDFFYNFPAWAVSAWAIGVWGGVLGALLLLLRKRLAVWVFLASLVGVVVTDLQNYVLADGMRIMGGGMARGFVALIFVLALVQLLYARAMSARGVLV